MYSCRVLYIYEIGTHFVTTFLLLNYQFYLPYPLYNFLEILFNTEIRSNCALHPYNIAEAQPVLGYAFLMFSN